MAKKTKDSSPKRPVGNSRRRSPHASINGTRGHVIGVDIGGSNLRIALADSKGTILGKWAASTKKTSSPDMVIKQIGQGVALLLKEHSIPRSSLLAVAAGAPGVTDTHSGVVFATSYLRGWRNVQFGRLLESALCVPAAVENDVKLAAIGEHWIGVASGVRDFVFLAIGTGIGAGVFVNGELIHGPNWSAGEVGYMIVPGVREPSGELGAPGSLESILGGDGIIQQWLSCCDKKRASDVPDLSATKIFEMALTGDPHAKMVLAHSAQILAYAIYNMSIVVNSSLFVLGGGVGMSAPLLAATQRVLEKYNEPARPKLTASSLGHDAQLIGAVRLALNKASARPSHKK